MSLIFGKSLQRITIVWFVEVKKEVEDFTDELKRIAQRVRKNLKGNTNRPHVSTCELKVLGYRNGGSFDSISQL